MEYPKRKQLRMTEFDYSGDNLYYVTICTHSRQKLFGLPEQQSEYGLIAEKELRLIPERFEGVRLDKYIIMPDHIHAVIIIGCLGAAERSRPFPTLSTVVGLYKSGVSRRIHLMEPELRVWQKSYYERVIRCEDEYLEIWSYIDGNPQKLPGLN